MPLKISTTTTLCSLLSVNRCLEVDTFCVTAPPKHLLTHSVVNYREVSQLVLDAQYELLCAIIRLKPCPVLADF